MNFDMAKRIAIFGNSAKSETREQVQKLLATLAEMNVEVVLSNELRQELNLREYANFDEENEDSDIFVALSVGGDGTFLTTANMIGSRNIPILGINCGRIGFLADIRPKDAERAIKRVLAGKFSTEKRRMLEVTASGGHLASCHALNEIAVLKQGLSSLIAVETRIDGEYLHTYQADGLVIATPTGSTAYNMSAGGPIMMPGVRGTILTPIAGHSLNVRPMVVPEEATIDLTIQSRNGGYMVSVDGRSQQLGTEIRLSIRTCQHVTTIVRVGKHNFVKSLKEKLSWG